MGCVGSHPGRTDVDGEVDIFFSAVDCDGNEAKLIDCRSLAGGHCDREEVASVTCEGV